MSFDHLIGKTVTIMVVGVYRIDVTVDDVYEQGFEVTYSTGQKAFYFWDHIIALEGI